MKKIFILISQVFWIFLCSCSLYYSDYDIPVDTGEAKNAKYISNVANANTIFWCSASSESGLFVKCLQTATTTPGTYYSFKGPWGMAPTTISGSDYVYISDSGNNRIVRCNLNIDHTLSGCSSASSYSLKSPTSVSVYKGSSVNYMYIANGGSGFANTVVKCIIQSDGSLISCGTENTGLGADQISLSVFNNYLYVASASSRIIYKCSINSSSGALTSCATTGPNDSVPLSIALTKRSTGNTLAYIADARLNKVLVCVMNETTGVLNSCSATATDTAGNSFFKQPSSVSITDKWAYVTDYGSNTTFVCEITDTNGALLSCFSTGTGYSGPVASI